ncbi:hypothetical protein ACHHYP_01755 [Achlya hypogyna]|uniref:Methyltransferase type 11 domain-containing protein n=1 Tax=Achlya hypogyna TaxID=1202772 RepID=A0A1V9ZTW5_ACHHY|nr:hypothetical protein ACHHYP_01755 [Achlya hypogyna]
MEEVQGILAPYFPRPTQARPDAALILVFSASWAKPANDRFLRQLHTVTTKHSTVSCLFLSAELDQSTSGFWLPGPQSFRSTATKTLYRYFDVDSVPQIRIIDARLAPLSPKDLVSCSQQGITLLNQLLAPPSESPRVADAQLLHQMRHNANVMYDEGDFHGAASVFSDVLALAPTCIKSNFNLAVILHTMGQTRLAVAHMLRVVEVEPADATAHSVLRTVFFPAEPALVMRGYAAIVARHPDHLRAAHALAALRGDAKTSEKAYVRAVFDELAESFEDKLVTHLHYKVPWQLLDGVKETTAMETEGATWRMLDLGCGTGLCGRLFKPFLGHIIGVDISPLMVEKTRSLGSYDEVYADDLLPVLAAQATDSLDLILAADVWIYVGDLDDVLRACRRVLKPTGYLAFSIEELSAGEFKLVPSGRFQHSRAYVHRLASELGYRVLLENTIVVRYESSEPIPGVLYVLQ